MGYYSWVAGVVPSASDLNGAIRDQTVILCTLSPDTRPVGATTGQLCETTDTSQIWSWNGSAWKEVVRFGAWSSWTPVITQSGTPSFTNSECKYTRIGRTVIVQFAVVFTGGGTAGNQISCSLPVTGMFSANKACGSFWYSRPGALMTGATIMTSANDCKFISDGASDTLGYNPSFAIANGDTFTFNMTYEAAS